MAPYGLRIQLIHHYNVSIALKAAELQGRRAGIRFLRKLQEMLFLEKQNISNFEVLVDMCQEPRVRC